MITTAMMILDVLVLGFIVMDYIKTSEYLEEQEKMKAKIRKVAYDLGCLGDTVSYMLNKHG